MTTHGWMLVCVTLLAAPCAAHAQTATTDQRARPEQVKPEDAQTPAPVPRRARPMRKPIIDLRALARDRRPGQVMPGDPTPLTSPIPELAPLPAAPAAPSTVRVEPGPPDGPIDLPESAPVRKPVVSAPANDPPAPMPAEPPRSAPVQPEPEPIAPAPVTPSAIEAAPPVPPAVPTVQVVPVAPAAPAAAESAPVPAAPADPEPVAPIAPPPAPATRLDGVILADLEPALSLGPAALRIERRSGSTQWRSADTGPSTPWTSFSPGDQTTGRIEIRAGIDADAEIIVDDRVALRLSRLGRAVVERSNERSGASSVSITLARGTIELRPLTPPTSPELIARIKTPDQSFGVTGPVRVEYDAFAGTRRRVGNP